MPIESVLFDRISPFPDLFPPRLAKESSDKEKEEYQVDRFIENQFKEFVEKRADLGFGHGKTRFLEDNIADHSTVLSRITEYRSAIIDLEANRIRTGLAYAATIDGAEADYKLEVAKSDKSEAVKAAAAMKRDAVKSAVSVLQKRHGLPGSALNYNERRQSLEDQIAADIKEAYHYAADVINGLDFLNIPRWLIRNISFPDVNVSAQSARPFFENWIEWNREMLRQIEALQASTQAREIAISLGSKSEFMALEQRMSADDGKVHKADISQKEVFQTAVLVQDLEQKVRAKGPIRFDLRRFTAGWPFADRVGSFIGLRAVGLTLTLPDDQKMKWTFGALLTMPGGIKTSFSSLSNRGDGPTWFSDFSIYNVDPRGSWYIEIDRNPFFQEVSSEARLDSNQWPIKDIQLHLKVAVFGAGEGEADKEPDPKGWQYD